MVTVQENMETLRSARKKNRSVVVKFNGQYANDIQVSCGIANLGNLNKAKRIYNDPQYAWEVLAVVERNNNAEDKVEFVTVR